MGKMTSIYLTDEEVAELKKFCNENQCTQYSALKTALRELLCKPIKETEEKSSFERETLQESEEEAEEITRNEKTSSQSLQKLLKHLQSVK